MSVELATSSDPKAFNSFAEFYPFYLSEHGNRTCRRLHFAGLTLSLACLVMLVVTRNPLWLLAGLLAGWSLRGRETGLRWVEKGLEARRESGSSLAGLTRFRNDAYGPLSAQPFGPVPKSLPCVITASLCTQVHGVGRA